MKLRRPYWNMEVESRLNTPEMRAMQWRKIQEKTRTIFNEASFWRSWIESAGVIPDDIKTWEDFSGRIPIFTKESFRNYAEGLSFDMDRIIEGLLGPSAKRLQCIAATSGTTGDPTPYPLAMEDQALWTEFAARALWRSGVYPGDRVLQAFGLSMFLAGVPLCMSLADYGACCVPVGAEAGTERILKYAKLFRPSAMMCTPSLAEHLIEQSGTILGASVDTLGIRTIICGGEPGAGIPEVRRKIENAYKAKLFDMGAGLGCSCDSAEYQGMHWLGDDLVVLELVNQETHESIPLADGATGLAVFTTLEGSMALGYRQTLGDIMQVFTSPCPCGRTGFRYKIIGRNDDMLKVKGVMVYPAAVGGVINNFVPRVTGEFRIVLDEPPPRLIPPMKVRVEYGEGVTENQLETLGGEIAEEMHRRVKIRPNIEWVPPKTLERFVKKKRFFEKLYENV